VSATVQLEKSAELGAAVPKAGQRISITVCVIALALASLWWWTASGRDWIVKNVHPYRVNRMDISGGTMSLVHGNHSYVVRCAQHCRDFKSGSFYSMKDAGAVLEYTHAGQTISLPIIEEETMFDLTGGHG